MRRLAASGAAELGYSEIIVLPAGMIIKNNSLREGWLLGLNKTANRYVVEAMRGFFSALYGRFSTGCVLIAGGLRQQNFKELSKISAGAVCASVS